MPHPNQQQKPVKSGLHSDSSRKQQGGGQQKITKENKKQFGPKPDKHHF